MTIQAETTDEQTVDQEAVAAEATSSTETIDPQEAEERREDPAARGSKESVLADLARERDKRQAAEARLAELEAAEQERQREGMTEAEKAKADLEALRAEHAAAVAKLADIEHDKQRAAIAAELNIPAGMAGRIQGETPEEMRADATKLAEALGPYTGPSDPSAGRGNAAAQPKDLESAIRGFYTSK